MVYVNDLQFSYLRAFDEERKAKMGVVECQKHNLVEPFNVLWDKEGMTTHKIPFKLIIVQRNQWTRREKNVFSTVA